MSCLGGKPLQSFCAPFVTALSLPTYYVYSCTSASHPPFQWNLLSFLCSFSSPCLHHLGKQLSIVIINSIFQLELSVQEECLLWGNCVVIPTSLQSTILLKLHSGHLGVSVMKAHMSMYVWWPGIVKEVETLVQNCRDCQSIPPTPPVALLHCCTL